MLAAGPLLLREGFVDGWADIEDGIVRATGHGPPPSAAEVRGIVLPAPTNAHTHLGDAALKGKLDPSLGLAALVKPPHGLKHRLLSETPEHVLEAGMCDALRELAATGSALAVDFREGGPDGVAMLARASATTGVPVRILGRAPAGDRAALAHVVREAAGVGIPSVGDLPPGEAAAWAREAHAHGKWVAAHASEGGRDDIEAVLALRPHHIVHMTHGTSDDFQRVAEAGALLVVCPRSNAALVHRIPNVSAMLKAGCDVALGTDNASLQSPDLFEEMAFLREHGRLAPQVCLAVGVLGWREKPGKRNEGIVEGAEGPFLIVAEDGHPKAALLRPKIAIRARIPGPHAPAGALSRAP
ncbi:MAG: amidohydrolase family protein [Thermoplasmatota archaeon]